MILPGCYIRDILRQSPGSQVIAHGWVKARRDGKNVHFIQLNDGSSTTDLQVIAESGTIPRDVIAHITTGACISVEGELAASPYKGQTVELKVHKLILHSPADPEQSPLQKKRDKLERLRELGHLRPNSKTFSAVFRVRNRLAMAIHEFFQERGFLYVHTPLISVSDAEGAGSMFQVTTLDPDEIAKSGKPPDYENQDFFRRKTFLTVSGQLQAEAFAHAFANVYTFGPTFRAEHSDTQRHLAEFYMIAPEMAFCDLTGNRTLAESFLKSLAEQVVTDCEPDLKYLSEYNEEPDLLPNLKTLMEIEFEHVTYTDAIGLLQGANHEWNSKPEWGKDLQSEHERSLTEDYFHKPVIVTDYPRGIKAFYMRDNDDGKTVAAMDVLVPRVGEIIGGSQREERYDVLLHKIRELDAHGDPHHTERRSSEEEYSWYLDLRRFGSVPHSGFGMGFERMLMYLTGMKNIRDVVPFPRAWKPQTLRDAVSMTPNENAAPKRQGDLTLLSSWLIRNTTANSKANSMPARLVATLGEYDHELATAAVLKALKFVSEWLGIQVEITSNDHGLVMKDDSGALVGCLIFDQLKLLDDSRVQKEIDYLTQSRATGSSQYFALLFADPSECEEEIRQFKLDLLMSDATRETINLDHILEPKHTYFLLERAGLEGSSTEKGPDGGSGEGGETGEGGLLASELLSKNYDVFISYNSEDRDEVREIVNHLRGSGVIPWFDDEELRPGINWQDELEEQLKHIKSAAIFIGKSGLGPWQREEMQVILRSFSLLRRPVIPVILSNGSRDRNAAGFLENRKWVDFRVSSPPPLQKLIWGITGKRPPE